MSRMDSWRRQSAKRKAARRAEWAKVPKVVVLLAWLINANARITKEFAARRRYWVTVQRVARGCVKPYRSKDAEAKVKRVQYKAFIAEQNGFKRGDEQRHWGNHPLAITWGMIRNQRRHDAQGTNYGISRRIRARLYHVLKGHRKSAPTERLLGCTWQQLRCHLESQFVGRMSWENYGRSWHIDHKIPCAAFDLSKPEQQRACFHFSNLQPLWAKRNWSKHARVVACQPELLLNFHATPTH